MVGMWNWWSSIGLWKEILIGYLAIGFILALVAIIYDWRELKAEGNVFRALFVFTVLWGPLFILEGIGVLLEACNLGVDPFLRSSGVNLSQRFFDSGRADRTPTIKEGGQGYVD